MINLAQNILTAAAILTMFLSFIFFISGFLLVSSRNRPITAQLIEYDKEGEDWEYAPLESIPEFDPEYTESIAAVKVIPVIYSKKRALEIAKEKGIKGRSKMDLAELLEAIAAVS